MGAEDVRGRLHPLNLLHLLFLLDCVRSVEKHGGGKVSRTAMRCVGKVLCMA